MKSIIKQLLRENLLTEKLTDIDVDVDMLFDKYFLNDVIEVKETGFIYGGNFFNYETDTSKLQSEECKKAHSLNPCVIYINQGSNYYKPSNSIISISVNSNAINFVKEENNGNIARAIEWLDSEQGHSLSIEFTEERIKGSIHHELVHWIDDTMNNQHINRRVNKPNYHPKNATTEKFEIQAQIHNIKQLKNKHFNIWDSLSFYDMLRYSPSLKNIYNNLSTDVKNKWIRDIKTRMYREGLLGKNMVNN
jgi:hypothetical protein